MSRPLTARRVGRDRLLAPVAATRCRISSDKLEAVLLLGFAGPAHRLAGFFRHAPVFGVSGSAGCKPVIGAGSSLLGFGEMSGCCRGLLAKGGNTVGQVGDVALLDGRILFGWVHQPGGACLIPVGACVRTAERGFGAPYAVLVGV